MDKGSLVFKLWFRNGTYMEKEVVFDENTPQEDIDKFGKSLPSLLDIIKKSFREELKASININNLYVRVDELIAFDIIPNVSESED